MTARAVCGIHHLTFPVSDLEASLSWYMTVLGAVRLPRLDHHDTEGELQAIIAEVPGLGAPIQLRLTPALAASTVGYNPVTFAVADRADLDWWAAHLDGCGVAHSAIAPSRIGESMELRSPDGLVLRFYTRPVGPLESVTFTE